MASQVTVSLDAKREEQLAKIGDKRKDIPKGQGAAIRFLLFEKMDAELVTKQPAEGEV